MAKKITTYSEIYELSSILNINYDNIQIKITLNTKEYNNLLKEIHSINTHTGKKIFPEGSFKMAMQNGLIFLIEETKNYK